MRAVLVRTVLLIGLFQVSGLAMADHPLPPPRMPGPLPPMGPPVAFYRPNPMGVWLNYDVTTFGTFRPIVIAFPDGGYYYADGKPFPWLYTRTVQFMPYAYDY